jgi:Ca2+-binding RTX toxin-like protein
VDDAGDKTIELAEQGSDTVFSTVTWTLAAETENLTLIGQGVLSGTGNALDNRIRGNDSGNTLSGLAGNDTLQGGSGNDTMAGGDGDDTYYVSGLGDVVQDTTGIDTVVSYISGATIYNLAAPVENLVFGNEYALPPAVMKGNGNTLDNRITANLSANAIDGGAGNDTLDFNIVGSLTAADTLSGGLGNDMVANDTLLADITGASLLLTNMSAIETAVLRAEGASGGSIDFGATGWASLRAVEFTGSLAANTLTVNNAPHTGFVNNVSTTPLVFSFVDFNSTAGVTINGDNVSGTTDVLNLAIRDSALSTVLNTAGWETIRINNQPSADGSFANNTLDMSGLTVSPNQTVIEVTGSGGSPLTLTALKPADLTGGTAFDRNLQVSVVNFDGRLALQESNATASDVIQVNVRDSSFWLDAGLSGGTSRNFETIEINALGPLAPATVNTSFVHLNEASTLMGGTLSVSGVAGSVLSIDGIRAGTINASTFAGSSLFLTADSTAAGTWTGPTSGAVNFVFTGGGGNDIFNFTTAGSVDGMDQVFGGLGTDTVNVDITGMGVSGTAMSGGLHFEDTETINFTNSGTAVVDASMMDMVGNVTMTGGAFTATTIHGLSGGFNGGGFAGNVTIYADPSAGNATYSNFGAGTQILYGSQAQGVATTFSFGTRLDDADFVQGWDFDTGAPDVLSATLGGGTINPQIQGVETLQFLSNSGTNEINAANIVGAMTWTLTGTAALTLNGGVGTPINGANGMIINAGGLSGLFTLDASNTAETITLGTAGSLVNAWGGNDSVTGGGSGADTINGGDGDDTITGGGAADVLNGDAGNDTFKLGQATGLDNANDTVDGGAGNTDCLDYDGSTAITVTFTGAYSGTVTGTSLGTDSFANIERIIASQGNDSITGFHGYALDGSFPNYLRNYFGNVGNDTLNGGDNAAGYTDIADYGVPNPAFGVFANLGTGPVTVKGQTVAAGRATDMTGGNSVGTDTLTNIDGAFGSGAADILVGGSDSRSYNGNLFEQWTGNGGNDIIAGNAAALSSSLSPGAPGIVNLLEFDMIYFFGATSGVRVHFGLGTAQDGQGGNDLLFDIDQVQGSSFDDMLIGGNAQNDFFESFEGGRGDDYIDGRSGYDSARYQSAAGGINADLSTGIVQDGDGGTDVLLSIEHLRGGAGNDTMKGSAGNDAFEGMAGVDAIDGGAGFDRAEFGNSLNGVQVDLSLATGQVLDDGWGNVETLVGIESVRGSIHDDSLTGSGLNEFFDGRGGNDTIAGGGGIDGAGYSGAFGAVTVDLNLSVGTATGADGTDDLTGIENIVGSFYSDTLTGDANANRLEGAATKYWTYANTGTTDNDTLTGGAGSDVFVFNSALDATYNVDEITDFVSGTDKIELDDAIFAGLLVGSGSAANFAGNIGAVPADTNDFLLYDTATGALYYDADGNDGGLAVQFAQLTGAPTLSASDFVIA